MGVRLARSEGGFYLGPLCLVLVHPSTPRHTGPDPTFLKIISVTFWDRFTISVFRVVRFKPGGMLVPNCILKRGSSIKLYASARLAHIRQIRSVDERPSDSSANRLRTVNWVIGVGPEKKVMHSA